MTPSFAFVAALVVQATNPAHDFEVRPGTVLSGANAVAAQAGVDVVVAPSLRNRPALGLRGRMTTDQAFDRLLRQTGARAVRLADGVYRIEPTAPAPTPRQRPSRPPPVTLDEVTVTAPVRRGGLAEAAGRSLISPSGLQRAEGQASAETIADLSASVDSTRQGQGRNKLSMRGIADSAFNGPLQSTIGQYLGDLRLNYGSPDPDLALIDVDRIEVFEGPQGARFGAGAIGGVLRLQPSSPVLGRNDFRASGGLSFTSGGAPGADATLVGNHAFGEDAALRLVGYARQDGGFLDNPVRGVNDADQVSTVGGRGALRLIRAGWTLDLLGLAQSIEADDAQTVLSDDRRMARDRLVAEPYRSTLALAGVSASRDFGALRLTSATSLSRQTLQERFDATAPAASAPAVVDRTQSIWALSSEFRMETPQDRPWSWTGGAALALGETQVERRWTDLSPAPVPSYGVDLDRTFAEAALFGEVVARPRSDLRLAFGGRLSTVRIVYDVASAGLNTVVSPPRDDGVSVDFTPTVSGRWTTPFGWSVFARLDQAVRPGGVSESDGGVQTYDSDRVTLFETGVRTPADLPLTAEVSIGHMDWRDIQADVATQGGDLVTGNVGDGRIRFLSARAAWTPSSRLEISGGVFFNDSLVRIDRPSIIGVTRADIPNVAPLGAQFSLDHDVGRFAGLPLRFGADLRYVGRSRLGLGPGLDAPQGGYLRTDLHARLGEADRSFSLRLSNPFDVSATRYGIGSPYQLSEPQAVPVRPLTIRLGFDATF